ncbi:hypothetical protein F5Y14DRAFT_448165 [Nemania sp. NC0429]|nr:hypothetical protein F5Y14DRAFT_448165 [Nemania sp. NC0429]
MGSTTKHRTASDTNKTKIRLALDLDAGRGAFPPEAYPWLKAATKEGRASHVNNSQTAGISTSMGFPDYMPHTRAEHDPNSECECLIKEEESSTLPARAEEGKKERP